MRKIFILISVLLSFCLTGFAQDEPQVLIGNSINNISGFGGFMMELSSINHDLNVSTGGGGAVLLNQVFYIGGYGMSNHSEASYSNFTSQNLPANLNFHHGGLWVGYIFKPNKLIHYNVSTKFGWGNIRVTETNVPRETVLNDNIFALTPQVEAEINIAYWFRINASVGYRLVDGVNNQYYRTSDFCSPTFGLSFIFGWFKPYDFRDWNF